MACVSPSSLIEMDPVTKIGPRHAKSNGIGLSPLGCRMATRVQNGVLVDYCGDGQIGVRAGMVLCE